MPAQRFCPSEVRTDALEEQNIVVYSHCAGPTSPTSNDIYYFNTNKLVLARQRWIQIGPSNGRVKFC